MAGTNGGRAAVLTRGEMLFELSNHLGNVLATVSDRKLQVQDPGNTSQVLYYMADVRSATDYYPFGMVMPGRSLTADGYRYGFNGKEKDKDLHSLTAYDYGFRIYNPGIGRFLSVDPITTQYPELTPYQFASDRPIDGIDRDGLEWYYSNNIFTPGWQMSTTLKPPPIMATEAYKQGYYNKLGFLTLEQKNVIQSELENRQRLQARIKAAQRYNEGVRAYMKVQALNNPLYLAYELSPASTFFGAYQSFDEGDTWGGALNLALGFGGLAELKGLGLVQFSAASDFFDATKIANVSIGDIWKVTNNFVRGTLIENKLAQTIYKGYKHLGSTVSKFFKYIDFYDGAAKIGISLKSVNAKSNFNFKNILKNIDDLAFAKDAGEIVSNGQRRVINDVRLDIVIPKGYDRSVLSGVQNYADKQGVKLSISELE